MFLHNIIIIAFGDLIEMKGAKILLNMKFVKKYI